MVDRRYADYLKSEPAPTPGSIDAPVFAVVRPGWKVNTYGPHPASGPPEGWALTIESPRVPGQEHRGLSWDEVVRITSEARVEVYQVWSSEHDGYVRRTTLPD